MNYTSEYIVYIRPDGTEYLLHSPPDRFVLSVDGTGMPPIEYQTQHGPFQHGESVKSFVFQPRVIELLVRQNFCNRTDYWRGRSAIMTALSPGNPQNVSPGTLRQVTNTGEFRDIHCIVEEGPSFTPHGNNEWDEWAFTDVIRFIAHDPIYYNPQQKIATRALGIGDQLQFPVIFPIQFTQLMPISLAYAGNWREYPTITIPGPALNPIVHNLTTDEFIKVNYAVPSGMSLIISLEYGNKRVNLDDGTNLLGYTDPSSDLTTFAIYPHPTAPNGVNDIKVFDEGSGIGIPFSLAYYDRYVGLGL